MITQAKSIRTEKSMPIPSHMMESTPNSLRAMEPRHSKHPLRHGGSDCAHAHVATNLRIVLRKYQTYRTVGAGGKELVRHRRMLHKSTRHAKVESNAGNRGGNVNGNGFCRSLAVARAVVDSAADNPVVLLLLLRCCHIVFKNIYIPSGLGFIPFFLVSKRHGR